MSCTFKESEVALLIAVALAAALPALHVAQARDAAAPCDVPAALEAALRARLSGVRVDQGEALAPGDLRVALARSPPGWLLELRGEDGVKLARALPLAAGECAVAAETSALIVERFLEEVRWSGRPQRIEPLPAPPPPPAPPLIVAQEPPAEEPPPPAPAPAPATVSAQTPAATSAQTPAATSAPTQDGPPPRRLSIALGPAVWLGLPGDLRAAGLLLVSVRAGEHWRLGGAALLGAGATQTVTIQSQPRGETSVSAGLLSAHGSLCLWPGALSLCGGALAGVRGSLGSSSGTLFQQSRALLWQPEVGLRASAGLRLSQRWELGLELLSGVALGSASFVVSGASSPRALPSLDVAAALRLAWEPP